MRKGIFLYSAVLFACAMAFAAGTAGANARRPEEIFPPTGFRMKGTNGFTISGTVVPSGLGSAGGLALVARRGKATASYYVAAKVTPDSVRADMGRLGRVDLVLHISGEMETAHSRCDRESTTYEAGTWDGLVEFDGEAGYTRVRATEAPALPELLTAGRLCELQSTSESFTAREPGAELKGVSFAAGRTVKFQVNKNRRGGRTVFTATSSERERGIRIFRQLSGSAPAGAFRYDRRIQTATLSPPAPFAGSAHLRRSPDMLSPIWTGDLELTFPGRTVPLAGPSVHVSLRHARLTHGSNSSTISVGI